MLEPPKAQKATAQLIAVGGASADGRTTADGAQFLQDGRWAKVFIPTIAHALYISREPFLEWALDSRVFLATLQHVFNISFSNITFTLRADDPIVVTVRL